jgi:hypothetical protein
MDHGAERASIKKKAEAQEDGGMLYQQLRKLINVVVSRK